MRKLMDEKQTGATRRPHKVVSENGKHPDDGTSIRGAEIQTYPANLSWDQLREKVRQDHGEVYFKERSREDLIEDFVTVAASEGKRAAEVRKLTEENAILLQRIDAMKKEITQLRQLNDAYGISLDRFFESRSVTCLRRT